MIELDQHEGSYLAICKHYLAIYNTDQIKKDKDKMKEVILLMLMKKAFSVSFLKH